MKKQSTREIIVGLVVTTLLLTACGSDDKTGTPLAKINGRTLGSAEFNAYLKFKGVPETDKARFQQELDDFLNREALADVIEKTGKLDAETIAVEINEFKKQILISRYVENFLNESVTEDAVKNFYSSNADKYQVEKVKVSHILIRTHPEMSDIEKKALLTKAQEVYSKAKTGKDFGELAKEYSQDLVSAKNGGSLGWLKEGAIDPVFSQKIFGLKVGEISVPFATTFGYHIVKVDEPPTVVKQPLESVQGDIRYQLRQQAKAAELERLTAQIKIEKLAVKE